MNRFPIPREEGLERHEERFGDDPNAARALMNQEMVCDDEFIRIGDEYYCRKELEESARRSEEAYLQSMGTALNLMVLGGKDGR